MMPGAAATVLPRCAPPRHAEQNARLALGTPRYSRVGSLLRASHVEPVRLRVPKVYLGSSDRIISRVEWHHGSFHLVGTLLLTWIKDPRESLTELQGDRFFHSLLAVEPFAGPRFLRARSESTYARARLYLHPGLAVDRGSRRELYHRIARRYTRAYHGRSHADRA